MVKVIRYRNKTLYVPSKKRFINYETILTLGDYYVVEKATGRDVTKEVAIAAEFAYIKKNKLQGKTKVNIIEE